jgi:hypothetical protein
MQINFSELLENRRIELLKNQETGLSSSEGFAFFLWAPSYAKAWQEYQRSLGKTSAFEQD